MSRNHDSGRIAPNVPLTTLRIFEAAARRQSFHAAATELNLSPSAVSHAIRKMEDAIGVVLFERLGRGVSLTPEGEGLMRHVERGFDEFRRGLDTVSARAPRLLRLHSAPSFAAQWLTPRLSRFYAHHPDVEVRLSASTDYSRFENGEFDADIVYGLPRQEGLVVLPLAEETLTPLCAPHIASTIEAPIDLMRHLLIQSDTKQYRWPAWFSLNGISMPSNLFGSRFDRSFLAIAAAADGLGIALESTLLAGREIGRGRLVAPLSGRAQDIRYVGHHLVYPRPIERKNSLRSFSQWLARELGIDLTPFF